MTPIRYEVLCDRVLCGEVCAMAGDIVYYCMRYDYGCAGDDRRATGRDHISVTKDPTGDYTFFTIPESDLKRLPPGAA